MHHTVGTDALSRSHVPVHNSLLNHNSLRTTATKDSAKREDGREARGYCRVVVMCGVS